MAVYKEIVISEDTDRLVKRSATVCVRRYIPLGRCGRIIVHLSSGWPMDRDEVIYAKSRQHARDLVRGHFADRQCEVTLL